MNRKQQPSAAAVVANSWAEYNQAKINAATAPSSERKKASPTTSQPRKRQ